MYKQHLTLKTNNCLKSIFQNSLAGFFFRNRFNLEILLSPFLEFYRVRQEVDQHTKKTDSLSQNLISKEHEILDLKRSKIELERSLSSLNKQIDDQSSTNKRYKIGGLAIKHT